MRDFDFNTPLDAPAQEEQRRLREATEAMVQFLRRATWEWCLLHNVAVGAALCRSYDLGRFCSTPVMLWQPGCGHSLDEERLRRANEPHAFGGDGCDCTICGEGACYYLHTDRPEYEP